MNWVAPSVETKLDNRLKISCPFMIIDDEN